MSDNIQKQAEVDELHKTLYSEKMGTAVKTMDVRLRNMMANSYFKILWNADKRNVDNLIQFFVPLAKQEGNSSRSSSTLSRESFIEVCHEDTKEVADYIAWVYKDKNDKREQVKKSLDCEAIEDGTFIDNKDHWDSDYEKRDKREKIYYKNIPDGFFISLIKGEFKHIKDDPGCVKKYFDCMDLQTYFKASRRLNNNASEHILRALQKKGLLKGKTLKSWQDLNFDASSVRNTGAHQTGINFEEWRKGGGPKKNLRSWIEIADILHSEELNEEDYKEVKEAWDEAVKLHNSKIFLFSDLLQDIQTRGLSDRNESDLYNTAALLKIPCKRKGALYNGSREELIKQLVDRMREDRWISLADLKELLHKEHLADGVEDLEAFFEDYGFTVRDGKVRGRSEAEVIALLKMRVDERRSYSHLPKLVELAEHNYKGGPMNEYQLRELVRTHQLILDASVVCSRVGRDFIEQKLLDLIEDARSANPSGQGKLCLCMDKTTYYNIEQNHRAYQFDRMLEKNRENKNSSASTISNEGQLKPYDSAYIFIKNILFDEEFLELCGEKFREIQGREMLLMFLKAHPGIRFCVLTCGDVSELVVEGENVISKDDLPLCAVARVQGDYYKPDATISEGPNLQIFSQYLPLEVGGTEVDYDKPLRDQMRLPEGFDEFGPEAFEVPTEDGGQAPIEEKSESEPEQSPELTVQGTEIYKRR